MKYSIALGGAVKNSNQLRPYLGMLSRYKGKESVNKLESQSISKIINWTRIGSDAPQKIHKPGAAATKSKKIKPT